MFFKNKKGCQVYASTIIVLVLAVILAYNNYYRLALIVTVLYVILLTLSLKTTLSNLKETKKDNDHISKGVGKTMESNLLNCVYPACILRESGEFQWCNKRFREEFKESILEDLDVSNILKDINIEKVLKSKKSFTRKVKIKKIVYEVYGKKFSGNNGKEYVLINFNEIAEPTRGTKQSVVLVEVDNLEEVMASIDQENRPMFLAEIEKTINKYADTLGAMMEKYDDNKYILSVLDSIIDKEINRKFDILDRFREIDFFNKVTVTLSMGIGRYGLNPQENQVFASKALELALGRGGDQVVIKTDKEFQIFGGNAREKEKRTRVKARVIAHALKDLIYESSNVFIVGHKKTDMDCFGSAIGLRAAVNQLGKECKIVLEDNTKTVDNFIRDLIELQDYNNVIMNFKDAKQEINNKSLIIVVDVHNESYISNFEFLSNCDRVVIIDHHRISTDYIKGALLNYIEVYASSTSELITEMIQYMLDKPVLKRIEAEALLAGICLDTKNFTFKTGVRTFEAAAFLRKLGADTVEVKKIFDNDISSYLIKAEVIKSAVVKDGIAIAKCPEIIQDTALAAQGADELLNITGINCSFVFVRVDHDIYLSSRSLGDINVQLIMEDLGGGGHMTMAGTKFSNSTMDEAVEKLQEVLKKYLKEGEQ